MVTSERITTNKLKKPTSVKTLTQQSNGSLEYRADLAFPDGNDNDNGGVGEEEERGGDCDRRRGRGRGRKRGLGRKREGKSRTGTDSCTVTNEFGDSILNGNATDDELLDMCKLPSVAVSTLTPHDQLKVLTPRARNQNSGKSDRILRSHDERVLNPLESSPVLLPLKRKRSINLSDVSVDRNSKQVIKRKRLNTLTMVVSRGGVSNDTGDIFSTGNITPTQQLSLDGVSRGVSWDQQIDVLRSIVVDKLCEKRPIPLQNLSQAHMAVYNTIVQAITLGEANSTVIVGPRGSGKSAIMNTALREADEKFPDSFYVVRLCGYIHTDDRTALREIWRQLSRLAWGTAYDDDDPCLVSESYSDALNKLLATLSRTNEDNERTTLSRAVIFILDDFEQFAGHMRQTLLYNLFDIAQSRKAPIAVFGLTTRLNVVESFEKRVKSRFGHRYVNVWPAEHFTEYVNLCIAAVSVSKDELRVREKLILDNGGDEERKILKQWNNLVCDLFSDEEFSSLYTYPGFLTSKSIMMVLSRLILPIAQMKKIPDSVREFKNWIEQFNADHDSELSIRGLHEPESKLESLVWLNELQLALLITACRLEAVYGYTACNFDMVYAEYSMLTGKARLAQRTSGFTALGSTACTQVWSRDAARICWEGLAEAGWLVLTNNVKANVKVKSAKLTRNPARSVPTSTSRFLRVDLALEDIFRVLPDLDKTLETWCTKV